MNNPQKLRLFSYSESSPVDDVCAKFLLFVLLFRFFCLLVESWDFCVPLFAKIFFLLASLDDLDY
jgi:hypothetical protein